MKVQFSETALLYLRSERDYIARFNTRAAAEVVRQIRKAAEMLGKHPSAGKGTLVRNVRRYVSGAYHIDYITGDGTLVIVAIRHGRQHDPAIPSEHDEFDAPDEI